MIKYIVSDIQSKTTSTGKPMFNVALTAPDGVIERINLFDPVTEGQEIDGEIYTNEKGYRNFKSAVQKPSIGRPNMDRIIEKKQAGIAESQERKASNISEAQTRNETMWAKYGACELVAHHPAFKSLDAREVQQEVITLAGKILTGDLIPF